MSWATIRDGMKTRLATISGLQAKDVVPANMQNDRDIAVVVPDDPLIERAAHGGAFDVMFSVVVQCARGPVGEAQDAIDAYVWPSGTNSIQAAVEGDPTLGGVVDDTQFMRVTGYRSTDESGVFQAQMDFRSRVLVA